MSCTISLHCTTNRFIIWFLWFLSLGLSKDYGLDFFCLDPLISRSCFSESVSCLRPHDPTPTHVVSFLANLLVLPAIHSPCSGHAFSTCMMLNDFSSLLPSWHSSSFVHRTLNPTPIWGLAVFSVSYCFLVTSYALRPRPPLFSVLFIRRRVVSSVSSCIGIRSAVASLGTLRFWRRKLNENELMGESFCGNFL